MTLQHFFRLVLLPIMALLASLQPLPTTAARHITEFIIPRNPAGLTPLGIAVGPDGALWFTELGGNKIGHMTTTGNFSDFTVPTPISDPYGITTGPDGALWFTEREGNKIGRLTPTGSMTEFVIPTHDSQPYGIVAGVDGALWFTENRSNKIGRLTTSGTFTEYAVPTPPTPPYGSGPYQITAASDGDVWFTRPTEGQLGQVHLPVPAPHDQRYFAATGYRIDDDRIWAYVQTHGGVATFGYPVSRRFRLLGFPVQIFQRQVLQVWPNGSVHAVNLLDPNLLPVTGINFSTFPPHDPAVAQAAPLPTTSDYGQAALRYLQASVPDRWDGQNVTFLQTYLHAAPAEPGALRALFALDVWGFPTSRPLRDPNNTNFISQRFQRGILQYDATTGVTRGILLADAFKAVLLGQGPADLQQQMHGSPFFQQYCPQQPDWLCQPAELPQTNLSFAFERQ